MPRRRLGPTAPHPVRILGGEVAGEPSPVDGSATVSRAVIWEGTATSQPLPTAEAVAQGRAVEKRQRAFFLPAGLPTNTGHALEADLGRGWETWELYKVEPWEGYTYALAEREAAAYGN